VLFHNSPETMIMRYDLPINSFVKSDSDDEGDEKDSIGNNLPEYTFCEGYLYVQNRSFWRFPKHVWKRKYFTLKSDSLYISECKNEITQDSTCIKIGLDTGIYPRDNINGRPKYYIRITTGKQNYTLRSTEEDDRNTWITSLLTSMSNTLMGTYKFR